MDQQTFERARKLKERMAEQDRLHQLSMANLKIELEQIKAGCDHRTTDGRLQLVDNPLASHLHCPFCNKQVERSAIESSLLALDSAQLVAAAS